MENARIIRILDADRGRFEEASPSTPRVRLDESQIPYPRDHRGRITVNHENVSLAENGGMLSTPNFPDLIRLGLQTDLWVSYTETPVTYPQFARVVDSNKPQEEYLKDSPIGLLPEVLEGQPYPEVSTGLDSGVIIVNRKKGMLLPITEEIQKFDQVGKVRELAELLGRAARRTEEQDVMNVLTTAGNYTRNSTTGDNDQGANTAATTFSAQGLIDAYNCLRTMKDRKTGVYLNVMPDTLVVTPKLWWAAQQLIQSPESMRAHGANTAEVYGTGTRNSFFNMVRTVIVSPELGASYQWVLMEANRAITFQRVEPIQILQESMTAATQSYLERDVIRYRVRNWYGVGMRDDRYAYFSSSTTAPAVS